MKTFFHARSFLLAAAAACLFSFQPSVSEASERLSYRADRHYKRVARDLQNQKQPRRNTARPAMRVIMGTSVYRYEDDATARHDEVSSPEVIFHLENGRVYSGHAYDR